MIASKKYLILKTVFMVLGPAAMGIYLEIVGPTLPDLKYKLDATYEEIARVLVARSVGYFVSSIVGGILADCFPHHVDITLAFAFLLGAVGTGAIPWCDQLFIMAVMFHLQGLGQGLIDTSNNSLCVRMWQKKAAAPLHALHFGFGLGALLAPQIARPFISNSLDTKENYTNENSSMYEHRDDNVNISQGFSEQIYIPYTISCFLTFMFMLVFIIFYVYEKCLHIEFVTASRSSDENDKKRSPVEDKSASVNYRNEQPDLQLQDVDETEELTNKNINVDTQNTKSNLWVRIKKLFSPGSCANGDTFFGIKMFVLVFIFYGNIVGGERAYGKFVFSYATNCDIPLSIDEATFINSLFWLFFTSGRGIAVVLSNFIKPSILLPTELLLNVLISIVLCIWGYDVKLVLYIFSALIGMVLSPVFPAGMAWVNNYIDWKGVAVSIVFIGAATGGMIYQWLTGLLFDMYGPQSLMFVMLGYALLLSSTFILMVVITFRRPYRFVPVKNNE